MQDTRMPDIGWLIVAVVVSTLAAFITLGVIHEDRDYDGDRAMTQEFADCTNAELDRAIRTGDDYDADVCKPTVPWYAAHPFWYALAIGGVVFVVGGMVVLLHRTQGRQ
jgi:hypothetical protein